MSSYPLGLVGTQLTPALYQYLNRLIELGIFEGPIGNMSINPSIQPLVDAIHQVLAGGSVNVQVTTPGSAAIVAELADLIQEGTDQANEINKKVGFYLTATP